MHSSEVRGTPLSPLMSAAHPTGWSIGIGILLLVAGIVAIAAPFFVGVAASIFFGSLILLAGIAHLVYAWSERGVGAIVWQVLIGVIYLMAAGYLLLHPVAGVVTLTLILAFYIALQGVLELVAYARLQGRVGGATWFLVNGIVSLLLAALIFFHWPSSSLWAIGTLVGISLLMSGFARLTLPMGRRRTLMKV